MGPAPARSRAELDPTPHAGRPREQGLRADPLSAMTPRFNLFFRFFARRYFRDFDLDDETEQNEFVTNTLTLGTGLHPVGARWSIDTGYAIQWRAADYGDPTQPHSSRQQLATQVRWAF